MIVDCHVHILNTEDSHLGQLLKVADRVGVDKLCISSLSRQWVEFPNAYQLEEAAEDVLTACQKHPDRFVGGTYVSADHVEKSLALIERSIAHGPCRFIKLWVSQFLDDPRLQPILERAMELRKAVLAHTWQKATGNMTRESTGYHAVNVVRRYPDLRLWIAHCNGRWEEAARLVASYPNLCMDISGGEPEEGIVECLLRHVSSERIFFGSDAPGRNPAAQMAKVLSARIPEETKKRILGQNVWRWLHD